MDSVRSTLKRVVFGFTLLELAVVLVIVSLMTGFGMKAMQSNRGQESNCYEQTRAQMRTISSALDAYQRRTGVYPRPAAINASPTGNTFGVQDGSSGTNITAAASNTVWIGALPFSTLGLPASFAADCWGNKFTYTVTQALSGTTSAYSAGTGAITVRTGTIASPTSLSTIGAYSVVSRGENALTTCARNFTGSSSSCYCNSSQSNAAITRIDKENCDTNNAVVYAAAFNNGQSATDFYDDIVIYKDKAATSSTNCVAQDVTWSTNCSGPVGALFSGSSTTITNTKSGYTGSATGTCSNGTVSTSSTSCTATAANCTAPWGATVSNGASVTAYLSATPSGTCTSETRTCTSGTLSGSYTAQTCTAGCTSSAQTWLTNCQATAAAAAAGGTQTLTNTKSGYSGSATATCNAGGSGAFALSSTSCNAACTLPWGGTIAHGASTTAYLSATPSGTCTSETRTCSNGTLSGTYTAQTCTAGCASSSQTWNTNCSATAAAAAAGGTQTLTNTAGGYTGTATATCNAGGSGAFALSSTSCTAAPTCSLPWGGTLAVGASVTAYLSATPAGACVSETRTCSAGASCTGPDGATIAHGASRTYYYMPTADNCGGLCTTCAWESESRTCTNGTLDGSATNASCNDTCSSVTTCV